MPKLYTKTGDKGTTSLYDGSVRSKSDDIFEVLGTIDELSSFIGLLSSHVTDYEIIRYLRKIQVLLIDISSIIATPDKTKYTPPAVDVYIVKECENEIDEYSKRTSKLTEFIITGVSQSDSLANVCRTTTRKVERMLIKYKDEIKLEQHIPIFINRLSDYFFALSRFLCPKEIKVSEQRKELNM